MLDYEREWLSCKNPVRMLELIGGVHISEDKYVAIANAIQNEWSKRPSKEEIDSVDYSSTFSPPPVDLNPLSRLQQTVNRCNSAYNAPWMADVFRDILGNIFTPIYILDDLTSELLLPSVKQDVFTLKGEVYQNAYLVKKSQLTEDVLSIAQNIWHSEDFTGVGILADALEETTIAGNTCSLCKGKGYYWQCHCFMYSCCENGIPNWEQFCTSKTKETCHLCKGNKQLVHPLVEHLRSNTKHYKGCWAIELIVFPLATNVATRAIAAK